MTKTAVTQIVVATVATVAAGLILDKLKQRNTAPPPPPRQNNDAWYTGLFGVGLGW